MSSALIRATPLDFDESLLAEDCTTAEASVRLRRLTALDATPIAAALNDADIAKTLANVPHPYRLSDAQDWLAGPARSRLAAAISVDGAFAGVVTLDDSDGTPARLGCWVAKPQQGRGVATLAVRGLIDLAFAATGIEAVSADAMPENAASARLLRRLGFRETGAVDAQALALGRAVRFVCFRLDRAAWAETQAMIETERMILRTPTMADAEETARLASDRPIGLSTAQTPTLGSLEEARAFTLRAARETRPANLRFLMRLKEGGALVGTVGWRSVEPGVVDLGFWLGADFRGRGLMTEGARAALEAAFRAGGAKAVRTCCRSADWASRQVVIRCGFQWEGSALVRPASGGSVAADQFRLDRETFLSFREWAPAAFRNACG